MKGKNTTLSEKFQKLITIDTRQILYPESVYMYVYIYTSEN
jgi:hypothetical protein